MEEDDNEKLFDVILSDLNIAIPNSIINDSWLRHLKEVMTDFRRLLGFLSMTEDQIGSYINEEQCKELYLQIKDIRENKSKEIAIADGDNWILNFLKSIDENDALTFFKLVGPIYYTLQISKDMDSKQKDLTDNIKAALFIYMFQNLYEILLSNIDSFFYIYLDKNRDIDGKNIKNYRKKILQKRKIERMYKKDIGKHASAAVLYGVIKDLYSNKCREENSKEDPNLLNATIFNSMEESLRNASAHFNAFYDDRTKKIVFLNRDEMSIDEFISLYKRLFVFVYEWMSKYIKSEDGVEFANYIRNKFEEMMKNTIDRLRPIERNGKHVLWYPIIWNTFGNGNIGFRKEK